MDFRGKKILLGITGGIAAYKIPLLIRLLLKEGAEVKVVITKSAEDFVTLKTLSVLTKGEVYKDFYDSNNSWNNHVELGLWADVFLIAPCTANTLAKMAQGICDNLLLATYLSMRGKVMVAPAMDLDMWEHPSTQNNLKTLKSYGVELIDPASGALASGLNGKGRLPEPESLLKQLAELFSTDKPWSDKKILITAGPTYEDIDPVRFIGNHSTGKMGYALAENFAKNGAEVTLVSGPTHLEVKHPRINCISVRSATQMLEESKKHFSDCHVAIFCAAVSDYKTAQTATDKIKREKQGEMTLALVQNPDIARTLSEGKKDQICVGFALETSAEVENAKGKLKRKNLDAIVLNKQDVNAGTGFGSNTNKIFMFSSDNRVFESELKSKDLIANDIQTTLKDWFFT
ncbi:bifunctional phosphopantothenoylcysteine decarboxylase/phosphopantothenate--cysteine ligase CoaBC [Luteibaculum oceani]|uniref:Coenzyme A biosynthesis bifunctional protein CoaBC n=1 Tax=Luteibaculum oceani TaxID=1294296 RepID=A0A5C6UV90_9FLAO|nr:bifunctional phosphopantothenoylcysteine decarboxylase/phosphopantothenate--cysteine ligase CoaBC [Luteibaculum oceani]TXC76151.1 bifunctional phosphopantothenoylcysteine decarboxylase/phosphopantothenate--cysteine ligase CoaBC [Luteibaculum oceani]